MRARSAAEESAVAETLTKSEVRHQEKLARRDASRQRHERRQGLRAERDRRLHELATAYLIGVRKVWAWWKAQ
jgi:hypothetical protein